MTFADAAMSAWRAASAGEIEKARALYAHADQVNNVGGLLSPGLSVLRHSVGEASGQVENVDPTEDVVISFWRTDGPEESENDEGMSEIHLDDLERNLKKFLDEFDPGFHAENIKQDIPHVLVMSTGRCGTLSIYHLLKNSRYMPYHTYWWHGSNIARWEAMCRLVSGQLDETAIFEEWLSMRAAEWLGAVSQYRPMIGLNHMDTIFSPVFASLHTEAKFIYLHRDPVVLFKSFYGKQQWGDQQILPVRYKFDPKFNWYRPGCDPVEQIAWYIKFTEKFSRAFGNIMGTRWTQISASRLFRGDGSEMDRLSRFLDIDLDLPSHFKKKINEKKHKDNPVPPELIGRFKRALWAY